MKRFVQPVLVASAMAFSMYASATTLYQQEGTQLDVYGRIAMGVAGGGPKVNAANQAMNDDAEFVDLYSRLGFRMSQQLNEDIRAFAQVEWRFTGDEQNTSQGFNEVRQSYLGLQSDRFGTLQAGNFNGLYYQFVAAPFDVYLDRGLQFSSSNLQSRGDSIGYYTPEWKGFTTFAQVKHYSERGSAQPGAGSEVAAQGGIQYQGKSFSIGVGAVDDSVRGNGNGEVLYGVIGSYQVSDTLSLRLGSEWQARSDQYGGGYDTVGLGGLYVVGPWAFTADYYRIDRDDQDDSHAWAAGTYYKLSSAFNVFVELADNDAPGIRHDNGLSDAYWVSGARYMF